MLRLESGIPWHAPEPLPDLINLRQAMKMPEYPLLLLAVVQRWLWLTVPGLIGYDAECEPRSDLTVVKSNIKKHEHAPTGVDERAEIDYGVLRLGK